MKSYLVVFLLGAVFLSANASILEHIYNNTRLRGNLKMHTEDGLKLAYDGGATIYGLEIAKVGGNIKAVPKYDLVGNSTNGSVDYSGEINIQTAKGDANVDVNGTAGLWAEWDKQTVKDDGSVGWNATVWNRANWNVDADGFSINAKSGDAANVSGRACKNGSKVFVKKRFGGAHWSSGNVTFDNDTHTFNVHSFGRGGLKKKVWINDKTSIEEEIAGPFPKVGYAGVAGVEKASWVKWDETDIQKVDKAGAVFSGLVWAEKDETNDTWISNVKVAKNADFGHKGYLIADGDIESLYGGKGSIGKIVATQVNVSQDLSGGRAGVFETGGLHHIGVVVTNPEGNKEQIQKEMLDIKTMKDYDLGQDFSKIGLDENDNHHGKKVVTYTKAGWAGGKGVNVDVNDDGTIDVDSKGGVVWHAAGIDSKHKKPWHKKGGHGFNSSFTIDTNSSTVKDIQVKVESNPKKAEEIKKMFEKYGVVEQRKQMY